MMEYCTNQLMVCACFVHCVRWFVVLGWLLVTVGWWSLDLSSAQITEAHMDAYVRDDLE